jgi:uncharacterized phage infection (PIP) family protein YhgE
MPKSIAELQNDLIAVNQAEAANTIALIEAVVNERADLHNIDFEKVKSTVAAVETLLDGNKDSEGFQNFLALLARLTAVETTVAETSASLANLLTLVNTEVAGLKQITTDLAAAFQTGLDALKVRVTTLEDNATTAAAARLLKDNEHDGKIATLEQTAVNTVTALGSEVTSRVAAVKVNTDALQVEKERIDATEAKAETFITRQERSDNAKAGGQAKINTLWGDRIRPAGLPNTDGSVSQ